MKAKLIGAYVAAILTFSVTIVTGVLIVMQSARSWNLSVLHWEWPVNAAMTLLLAVLVGVALPFLVKAMFRSATMISRHKQNRPKVTPTIPSSPE